MTALDPAALRAAFGSFMTGVTVVTAQGPQGAPCGFTANSFASVSLSPPLLLVCPGRFLSSFDIFAACSHFAVSVLADGQEDASNAFASYKGDRFARVPTRALPSHDDMHGVPVISGVAAVFSCTAAQTIPAGDHAVLIGEVRGMQHSGACGLGYAGGRYFSPMRA